jgi:hypothetical protein
MKLTLAGARVAYAERSAAIHSQDIWSDRNAPDDRGRYVFFEINLARQWSHKELSNANLETRRDISNRDGQTKGHSSFFDKLWVHPALIKGFHPDELEPYRVPPELGSVPITGPDESCAPMTVVEPIYR